ncbi:MAG: hypothetical protein RML46_07650 [Anaerolineae bacterium]|nr:hypothetical protein [Anaerolineae bacterium]MDW8068771.1 hypothetical protein [Anaerolineae bacterium]
MDENVLRRRESSILRLNEDWWAVIVGFLLIALVVLGILGPVRW